MFSKPWKSAPDTSSLGQHTRVQHIIKAEANAHSTLCTRKLEAILHKIVQPQDMHTPISLEWICKLQQNEQMQ